MVPARPVDEFCAAIDALRVDRSSGEPALHQPITLLWAVARAADGQPRLAPWSEVQGELRLLLKRYGRQGSDPSPEYPFVALSRSSLWELEDVAGDVPAARGSQVKNWLLDQNPRGGLTEAFHTLMATDAAARQQVADRLTDRFFESAKPDELLQRIRRDAAVFDRFGAVPGVSDGQTFPNRKALAEARVHRPLQAGICGTKDGGAESIVVSGGYEDDEDYGDTLIYTGQGGRDPGSGQQVRDQKLTLGNAALVTSLATGGPVRVVRAEKERKGSSSTMHYRYDGLYRVEDYWSEQGRSGHLVWRFRLVQLTGAAAPTRSAALLNMPSGNETPSRVEAMAQRIVRSTAVANFVKKVHDFHCQVCGTRLTAPTHPYAEAAHIRGLGRPHHGPDIADNVLCLCPNHHTLFDFGMLVIEDDLTVTDRSSGTVLGPLREAPGHQVDREHLAYHRKHYSGLGWHGPNDA
ncbi:Predicted restriction endonuclease [Streptomyces sp. TLI_053]|uniref:YDG/SRA domain-containing protein n=1 Tax=Streptomyces sp. TLI_053 TaxID=1855352 RepID=UPI00087C1F51|nr:YDG/SRA domain-containing protein [Streptomyces sp. TLI_053]SDT68689.1 Predicted restriction endonuclease [Streptomyces sp. TLI_053]